MTGKRFKLMDNGLQSHGRLYVTKNGEQITLCFDYDVEDKESLETLVEELNALADENEQLRNRLKDWHQRTFKAHEYFNLLEKVIDEVCDDDINNQIWKEYEKREQLIE